MTGLQVNIMNLIDLVNLDANFDEKHVGGRLPPTEDKKDENNAQRTTRKREETVLIESRLETRGVSLVLEE